MDIRGLPSDVAIFVQEEIASGHYQSEEELVTAALRLLKTRKTRTNGDTNQEETSQSDAQLSALRELVREFEALPLESPDDGFSVRDHDKLLYGEL
jgi:Arc/MetJ-type ribon-helix-helix transcriptional regulator